MEELRVAEEALSRLVAPDLDGDLPGFDDMRRLVDTWAEAIGTGDILRQRDVLRDLGETVDPVRVGRGSYAVRIGWTRPGRCLWEPGERRPGASGHGDDRARTEELPPAPDEAP